MRKGFLLRCCFALAALSAPLSAAAEDFSVLVSIADQKVYVFQEERLVRRMTCSTGLLDGDNDTPLGDFVIDESGTKRGEWFYSPKYREGAKYWVGFIGGTYLFHSVPMDKERRIIASEAAKLGKPASHGCVRLGLEDAHWFYKAIPGGTKLRIIAESLGHAKQGLSKAEVSGWIALRGASYRQKYQLSCEIALTRLCLGLVGLNASEDEILSTIPRSGQDPEKAFVCDELGGGRRNKDGSIHWNNYGAHPPVLAAELTRRMAAAGISGRYTVRELKADDGELRRLIASDPRFLGAIVWLVGHPERWGEHPKVNERGMVLGEHVRFLEPELAPGGAFRVWDPENGRLLVTTSSGAGRELFGYRVLALFSN
jgi:hypothetical protein